MEQEMIDEDFLEGLEDIDWDELEELCGSESVCCIRGYNIGGESDHDVCCSELDKENTRPSSCNDSAVDLVETAPIVPRFTKRVSDDQVCQAIVERIPKNTAKSTTWGTSVFEAWCKERNTEKKVIEMTDKELNDHIACFVHEAVKKDGCTPYPPNSLYQIVASIQRHLEESGHPGVAFFNEESPTFDILRKSLDARMKELTSQGYGINKKSAEPITQDMETKLWEDGIFSRETGTGLMNIVYFYNCKLFGLRAGDEHRSLIVDQYEFGTSGGCEYMKLNGRSSKTYNGGLKHRKLTAKSLRIFSVDELDGEILLVALSST